MDKDLELIFCSEAVHNETQVHGKKVGSGLRCHRQLRYSHASNYPFWRLHSSNTRIIDDCACIDFSTKQLEIGEICRNSSYKGVNG